MTNPLVAKIEKVLEITEPIYHSLHYASDGSDPPGLWEEEFEELRGLAVDVRALATQSGLEEHLPASGSSGLTALNLPGKSLYMPLKMGDDPIYRFFVLLPSSQWLDQLRLVAHMASNSKIVVEDSSQQQHEWSEAKSPGEWQKELRLSASTWRRRIIEGVLVVENITNKSVRIRLDTLRTLKGR